MKQGRFADRHGASAGAFMAAVLEYLTSEALELAGTECASNNMKTIQPKHINLAFRSDAELGQLMASSTFTKSSVPSNIHDALVKKGKGAKGGKVSGSQ